MGANGSFEDVWLEKMSDGLAQNDVISKNSDIRGGYTMKNSINQISRERCDSIDYRYYATRSRTLRSDAVISFFKIMVTRFKLN